MAAATGPASVGPRAKGAAMKWVWKSVGWVLGYVI
jgi:hypothetical protein